MILPISALLKADAIIFSSDFGERPFRRLRTFKQADQTTYQVKPFQNINIATGRDSLIVGIDLDGSFAVS